MSTANRLREGHLLGRYQIVRLIGEGGMGAVYEAIHPGLKKRFAIKTLLPTVAQTPEVRARFLREGETASRINHPNVVDVSDVGTDGDTPFLVMELLEGETVAELLAKGRRLEVAEAAAILLPVISAVVAGHDRGVIHRDLKPQNIFLARGHWGESIPKVLDFGVSKLTGGDSASLTGTLAVLGTAAYMSPEQARGSRQVDGQSDQYALGLVLYEMLSAVRAHPGDNPLEVLHNIANGTLISLQQLRPELPEPLAATLTRMLALAPADRFPSLRAAGRALYAFASERTRMAIPDAFREAPAGAVGARAPNPMARTQVMPEAPAETPSGARLPVGQTQLLPEARQQPDTTLSRVAAELNPVRRKSGRTPWIVAGLGVAAAAAFVWISTTKPQPAPSELPRPKVAAPPPTVDRPAEARPAEARPAETGPAETKPAEAAAPTVRRIEESRTVRLGPPEDPPPEARPSRSPVRSSPPPAKKRRSREGERRQTGEASPAPPVKTAPTPPSPPPPPTDTPKRGINNALIIQ